ncbi:hypothetical protein MRB53_037209 [Persea americana]|nr:hypothetical protein MRB53_037209 [Persea americana]
MKVLTLTITFRKDWTCHSAAEPGTRKRNARADTRSLNPRLVPQANSIEKNAAQVLDLSTVVLISRSLQEQMWIARIQALSSRTHAVQCAQSRAKAMVEFRSVASPCGDGLCTRYTHTCRIWTPYVLDSLVLRSAKGCF